MKLKRPSPALLLTLLGSIKYEDPPFSFSSDLLTIMLQHGFPSFALQFPKFKLGSSWSASLYGDLDAPHIEVPHGQLSTHTHPHLGNLNVGLSLDGTASYDAPDWKLVIAPTSFSVSAPKLYTGAGLHLLRGDDGEIGISFDKNSSRHFFFIGKVFPLSAPKFSLSLKVPFLSPSPFLI